jgi:hypothetical protein
LIKEFFVETLLTEISVFFSEVEIYTTRALLETFAMASAIALSVFSTNLFSALDVRTLYFITANDFHELFIACEALSH